MPSREHPYLAVADTAEPRNVRAMRIAVADFVRQCGAPSQVVDNVGLVVSEALTNVVVHAYVDHPEPGPMTVQARTADDGTALLVAVLDEGRGMMPRADSPGLGLGLPIVAQFADDFRVASRPDGNGTRVAMRFSLDGSGSGFAA